MDTASKDYVRNGCRAYNGELIVLIIFNYPTRNLDNDVINIIGL